MEIIRRGLLVAVAVESFSVLIVVDMSQIKGCAIQVWKTDARLHNHCPMFRVADTPTNFDYPPPCCRPKR